MYVIFRQTGEMFECVLPEGWEWHTDNLGVAKAAVESMRKEDRKSLPFRDRPYYGIEKTFERRSFKATVQSLRRFEEFFLPLENAHGGYEAEAE
jgi:hypothetical protein